MMPMGKSASPLAFERLLVALDLAVARWSAWPDEAVLDAVGLQELTQRAAVPVGEGVVGEQSLRLDRELQEVCERALDEAGHGVGAFVPVQLAVGVAGVVVDDRVDPLGADPHPLLLAAAVAVAGDGVSRSAETDATFAVDVQQIARAGPLVQAW